MKNFRTTATLVAVTATVLVSGCEEPDDKVARMADENARRQAAQNQRMAELQQEVAAGSRALVEADARAREEFIALQRQVQAERAEVGRQRDELEAERRADPIVAAALANLGIVLACLLPLVLCWYLLRQPPRDDEDRVVSELLIREIVAEEPRLLPPVGSRSLGVRAPDAGDDSDGEPGQP